MIKLVIGPKGSGKTGRLVDTLNRLEKDANVVCLESGKRLDRQVKPFVRLVDVSEYPVRSYRDLLPFIAGISAKDFDIDEIYVDSINKVAKSSSLAELESFVQELEQFSRNHEIHVTMTLSVLLEELPESLRAYAEA